MILLAAQAPSPSSSIALAEWAKKTLSAANIEGKLLNYNPQRLHYHCKQQAGRMLSEAFLNSG